MRTDDSKVLSSSFCLASRLSVSASFSAFAIAASARSTGRGKATEVTTRVFSARASSALALSILPLSMSPAQRIDELPRKQPPLPPLVTVDAEQPIQQRTAQRQQRDQQHPQRGRSRVTLEDDRVPRCGDSDRQRHEGGCPCQPVGVGHDSPIAQDSPPADFFLRAGLLASLGGVSAAFAASGFSGSAGFAGGSWRSQTTRSALSSQRALA